MTNKKITVLKLGGSLLTDKSTPCKVRNRILDSVASELKECFNSGLIESLVLIHGVGSNQMITVSFGEERPAALGSDEESWAKNRRVEIVY